MVEKLQTEQPDIKIEIVEDREREGSWPTYLRTLQCANGASHHLMLNDDLTFCRDFVASVKEVIQARPNDLISLYTNSQMVFTARHRRESWIQNSGVEGAAVIWPTALIAEFIEWQSVHIAPEFPLEDVRVSMWLSKTSRRSFATVPSLIQHLGCGNSLLGQNGLSKVAAWYVGDERSARGIDWLQGRRRPAGHRMHIRPEWWQHFRA
jgi:hypothetical protein